MNNVNNLNVKAKVKIKKYDNDTGALIGVEEREVVLTPEEVEKLCLSQKLD